MNDGPIERLPPHVLDLLALERDAYPEDIDAREAVFAKVERAVILAAPAPGVDGSGGAGRLAGASAAGGAAAARGTLLGKFVALGLAAFAAGGFVGATVVKHTGDHPASTPPHVAVAVTSIPSVLVPDAPHPPLVSVDDLPKVAAPSPQHPPTTSEATERPVESIGDLSRERELLDVARAALGHGTPDDAIHAAMRHAERWPHGALAEEREAVLIQALVAAGRKGDAEQRAAEFRRSFPRSMFAPAIAAALEAHPALSDAGSPEPPLRR